MKKLAILISLLPGVALAHGAHAPVDPSMHGLAHVVSAITIVALLVVIGLLWRARQ